MATPVFNSENLYRLSCILRTGWSVKISIKFLKCSTLQIGST